MATDVIQLIQSYSLYSSDLNYYLDHQSSWTHWTSSSSMTTSILLTALLALSFIRSVLSTFVDELFVMIVTLMLSTTYLHSLLSTSTLMPTLILSSLVLSAALAVVPPCNVWLTKRSALNVWLTAQFGWCDIDSSTLRSKSMSATKRIDTPTDIALIVQLRVYCYYYSYCYALSNLSVTLRDRCGPSTAGLSSNVTSWLLKYGGPNFVAPMKLIWGSFGYCMAQRKRIGFPLLSFVEFSSWLLKYGGPNFVAQMKLNCSWQRGSVLGFFYCHLLNSFVGT